MNQSAKIVWEGMQTGTFIALAPENRATLVAAFPVMLDSIIDVSSNDLGVMAIGYSGSPEPVIAWASVNGESGWYKEPVVRRELVANRPRVIVRFWREACRRIARAWDALCGRDE